MTTQQQFLRASNIYFMLALAIISASVGYGILQYHATTQLHVAITDNEATRTGLERSLAASNDEFQKLLQEQSKRDQDFRQKIAAILPVSESYTDLTRLFDTFFLEHDTPGNPIFQSSLRFGKSIQVKEFPGISRLPVSMNIEASRDNFLEFIRFITQSGSLDNGVRLMSISSIQLNFPSEGEIVQSGRQRINFTVDIDAYHQTPKVARTEK